MKFSLLAVLALLEATQHDVEAAFRQQSSVFAPRKSNLPDQDDSLPWEVPYMKKVKATERKTPQHDQVFKTQKSQFNSISDQEGEKQPWEGSYMKRVQEMDRKDNPEQIPVYKTQKPQFESQADQEQEKPEVASWMKKVQEERKQIREERERLRQQQEQQRETLLRESEKIGDRPTTDMFSPRGSNLADQETKTWEPDWTKSYRRRDVDWMDNYQPPGRPYERWRDRLSSFFNKEPEERKRFDDGWSNPQDERRGRAPSSSDVQNRYLWEQQRQEPQNPRQAPPPPSPDRTSSEEPQMCGDPYCADPWQKSAPEQQPQASTAAAPSRSRAYDSSEEVGPYRYSSRNEDRPPRSSSYQEPPQRQRNEPPPRSPYQEPPQRQRNEPYQEPQRAPQYKDDPYYPLGARHPGNVDQRRTVKVPGYRQNNAFGGEEPQQYRQAEEAPRTAPRHRSSSSEEDMGKYFVNPANQMRKSRASSAGNDEYYRADDYSDPGYGGQPKESFLQQINEPYEEFRPPQRRSAAAVGSRNERRYESGSRNERRYESERQYEWADEFQQPDSRRNQQEPRFYDPWRNMEDTDGSRREQRGRERYTW